MWWRFIGGIGGIAGDNDRFAFRLLMEALDEVEVNGQRLIFCLGSI